MQNLGPRLLNRALNRNLVDKGGATGLFASAPLDLRFALQKTLDSRVTFTRASTATFTGSDGLIKTAAVDAPRFDHNPTTGESLGLLVEEARTNLVLRSEELDNASWTKTNATVTANESTAPDGTTTADLITSTGATGVFTQAFTKDIAARTYTQVSWVKSDATDYNVSIDDGATTNRGRCVFNILTGTLTGTFTSGNFTNTSGTITPFPNSWYRITVTTTTSILTTLRIRNNLNTAGTTARVWGFQLEEGAFPTSYIPTTSATVTRAADVASITGSNFSSWYNQTEGTVFAEASAPAASASIYAISNNTNNERIILDTGANTKRLIVSNGGTQQANITRPYTYGTITKTSTAFVLNSFQIADSGSLGTEDTVGTMPSVDRLNIGGNATGTSPINGTIRRLTYWPTRLANTTLQQITQP
jgi:hypothetical protein